MTLFLENIVFYETNNYLDYQFVNNVLNNIDYYETHIDEINKGVDNIGDLYRYIWLFSFQKMVLSIDKYQIDKEAKEQLTTLFKRIKIDKNSFIKYLNSFYKTIFDKANHAKLKWHVFFPSIIDICFGQFQQGIKKEVFDFLEKNYPEHLLANFKSCSKYFYNHKDELEILFSSLEKTLPFNEQLYVRFLTNSNNKDNSVLVKKAQFICERAVAEISKKALTDDSEEIIYIQGAFKEYQKLAKMYHLTCANSFSKINKDIAKKLDAYIKKHGEHHKIGPIDVEPAINLLRERDDPLKFIQLTHNMDKDKRIYDALDYIFEVDNKNNPLSEIFDDISRNRSNKFPYFKQDSMQYNSWIRCKLINSIFHDKNLYLQFANYVYNICLQIQERYFNDSINIENEITGIVDSFAVIIELSNTKQYDTPYGKALTFGVSLSICSTIEKIIRNVALLEQTDFYFDADRITLADLLSDRFKLENISNGLKYHLEFYLLKEINFNGLDSDRPGLNLRNKMMHGQDDIYENIDYGTCVLLFYYLLSLLNDLVISSESV